MEKYQISSKHLNREVTYNYLKNPDSDIFIYFFDGQNLFDKEESYMNATFEMEDALKKAGIAANVIGLYSPQSFNRTNEYTPYTMADPDADLLHDQYDYNPMGVETGKFIVEELIPFIEKDKKASVRLIGGASLGGLMSFYMGATYPETFDKVLAMSSHFNINIIESAEIISKFDEKYKQKIYIDVGGNEYPDDKELSRSYVDLNKMAYGYLKDKLDSKFVYDKDGIHHEDAWADRLPEAFEYLLK